MQILLACAKNMTTRPDQKLPAGRQCQTPRQRRPEYVRLLETSPDQCADRFREAGRRLPGASGHRGNNPPVRLETGETRSESVGTPILRPRRRQTENHRRICQNVPRRHDPLYPSEPPDDPGGADCFFLRGIQLSTQSRPRESECITVCIGVNIPSPNLIQQQRLHRFMKKNS